MIDQKTVELLIQAKLKGGREFASIAKSITDLEEAIDKQSAAAKRGENSIDGLKAAQLALKAVQEELGGRSDVIAKLQTFEKQLKSQAVATDKAREKLEAFQKTLGTDVSKKQADRLKSLTDSYDAASKRLEQYRNDVATASAALKAAGVDTTNLAEAQRLIVVEQGRAAVALNRTNKELVDYSSNVNDARAAAARLAADQAKLNRLQQGNELDAFTGREQARMNAAAKLAADQAKLARLQQGNENDALLGREQARLEAATKLARLQQGNELDARVGSDQSNQRVLQDAGLRKTADDAQLASKQLSTLARASQDLRPKVVSLRDAIDGIINPAAKSRETLAGVESEIQTLSKAVASAGGPVKNYSEQFKALSDAQKALQGQAGLIDSFKKQISVLRDARTEFASARAQVNQYAAAVRQGGDAGLQFTKPLAEAQIRLRQAAKAMNEQTVTTRQLRESLRSTGIETNNLAAAEARIVSSVQQATGAMKSLTGAAVQNGEAVAKSGKSFSIFRDEGRTTLSLAQRIRGEILALAAAYVGVQGAISLAADSLKAFSQAQGLQSTLKFAFGGTDDDIGRQIQYIRDQTDRLGISFEQGSKGFAKFSAAAIKSGAGVQETQFIFEAFSEVARVIRLTPDELNGLFNAIGQSFSKGKIQAEELRQQIGERLPGAFAFAQQALKDKFPDLNKALEEGKVGAENMLLIAESVRKAAQGGLATSIKSLDAEQQRFNNSVLFFKQQIAEAGFADAYIALLKQLTEYFKSADGKEFAKALSDIGTAFVKTVSWAVEYKDAIAALAITFASIVASSVIARAGTAIVGLGVAFQTAGVAATLFTPLLAGAAAGVGGLVIAVTRLVSILGAVAVAGFSFGKYLSEQSSAVRLFGIDMVATFQSMYVMLTTAAAEFWLRFPQLAADAFKKLINETTVYFRTFLKIIQVTAKGIGLDAMSSSIGKALDELTLKYSSGVSGTVKALRDKMSSDLKEIEDLRRAQEDEDLKLNFKAKTVRDPSDNRFYRDQPLKVRPSSLTGDDGTAAKKRQTEIEAITKALEQMKAQTFKKQEDSLDSLLSAVDEQFADLGRRIAELGGAAGKDFMIAFRRQVAERKIEVTRDFNDKQLKEQQALNAKLDQLDASVGRNKLSAEQDRLDAIRTAVQDTAAKIQGDRERLLANGQDTASTDAQETRLEKYILEAQRLEKIKIAREKLTVAENLFTKTIEARDAKIAAVRTQQESGTGADALTDVKAAERINAINAEALPGILKAAAATREWAIANQAVFNNPAEFQIFLANLDATIARVAQVRKEFSALESKAVSGAVQAIDTGLNSVFENLGKVLDGQQSVSDGFDNIARSFGMFAAQFLQEIAIMIIKLAIFNALKKSGNIYLQAIGTAGAASVGSRRLGGVVGQPAPQTKRVSPLLFANAPRYQAGGIAGLSSDEYATILHKNEEVLTADSPRNIMNGGGTPAASQQTGNKFVLVDDRSRIPEAMNSPEGDAVWVVQLQRNVATVRQMLKG